MSIQYGNKFYEVLPCFEPTQWVAANVIPILKKEIVPKDVFNMHLADYLARNDEFTVVADWPEDIGHFCKALVFLPLRRIGPSRMSFIVDAAFFGASSLLPHNALADAKALREYYFASKQP